MIEKKGCSLLEKIVKTKGNALWAMCVHSHLWMLQFPFQSFALRYRLGFISPQSQLPPQE